MKHFKEAWKPFATIYIYDLYYKDNVICSFYTKEDALHFKGEFLKTAIYYYGTIEDVDMSEHLKIRKRFGDIETEIDFAKIKKVVKGNIEIK